MNVGPSSLHFGARTDAEYPVPIRPVNAGSTHPPLATSIPPRHLTNFPAFHDCDARSVANPPIP